MSHPLFPLQLTEWKRDQSERHQLKAYIVMERGGHMVPMRYCGAVDSKLLELECDVIFHCNFNQYIWQVRADLPGCCKTAGPRV